MGNIEEELPPLAWASRFSADPVWAGGGAGVLSGAESAALGSGVVLTVIAFGSGAIGIAPFNAQLSVDSISAEAQRRRATVCGT